MVLKHHGECNIWKRPLSSDVIIAFIAIIVSSPEGCIELHLPRKAVLDPCYSAHSLFCLLITRKFLLIAGAILISEIIRENRTPWKTTNYLPSAYYCSFFATHYYLPWIGHFIPLFIRGWLLQLHWQFSI